MVLQRLTIVDASVLSFLVSGNIMAVKYAVTAKADSVLVPLVKEEAVCLWLNLNLSYLCSA